jgi:GNAT superfamily N-acetyltransferase
MLSGAARLPRAAPESRGVIDSPPDELDALAIARIEEARQATAVGGMMRLGAGCLDAERFAVLEVGGGVACFGGVGSWANQAMGMGLDGPVDESAADALVDFFGSRGVEPRVELCSHADPSLVGALAARRFALREFENVLARSVPAGEDLEALRAPLPSRLRLERVDLSDGSAVDELGEVATSGFRKPGEPLAGPWLQANRLQALLPGSAAWVVRDAEGRAVAGASMEANAGGGASLFGTSVLPEHRRRGVQTRLMVERLIHARDVGSRIVTIHSSPHVATQRNAARLGFRLAYAKAILVRPGEGLASGP